MATIKAKAVLFIAIEMLADSISAFSAGLTCATAVNPLIRPDDRAQQAHQGDDVGERGDVVGALFQARHDFHHALLHRRVEVLAPTRALHPRQPVADDLAHGGVGVGSHALDVLELTLLQHRQDLCPDLAVFVSGTRKEDEPFDGNGHAQRHDQHTGVDEQAAILEELDSSVEGIHVAKAPMEVVGFSQMGRETIC